MLDGIHFSHREGHCKPNNCDGNAVTNTFFEDTCIRCNRCLKSERQKNPLIKDMPKETSCQASKQGSVQLIEHCGEMWHRIIGLNPVKLWGILDQNRDSVLTRLSCVSAGSHFLGQDQPQLILSEVPVQFCLLVTHGCKIWHGAGALAQAICTRKYFT